MSEIKQKRNPSLWVSILYFAEGLPYTVVNLMSIPFLKSLGASNQLIGLTSLLAFPWVLKGLWGPIVDVYSTKRQWILRTEIVCTFLFLILGLTALLPQVIAFSLAIFTLIAFVSATHDIAIDGFYLNALNKDQQALFVGVRNTAYRGAMIAGSGGLVVLAGALAEPYITGTAENGTKIYQTLQLSLLGIPFNLNALQWSWASAFGFSALLFLSIYLFQRVYLPEPQQQTSTSQKTLKKTSFLDAFKTYFTQDKIGWVIAFVLLFRLGDALTIKMATPFLMDPIPKGGMAISTKEIGLLTGTVGVIFLLVGGLIGGYLIAKQGLKKWMWPMAILQNTTNLLYWLLALYQPPLGWAYVVNSIEQFTYGLGIAAYTVFLMRTVRREYEASHYAITTAFMAAGVMIPGIFSGYLQSSLGYQNYFLVSSFAVIPGMITIFFVPLHSEQESATVPEADLGGLDE